jgi:cytochrome c
VRELKVRTVTFAFAGLAALAAIGAQAAAPAGDSKRGAVLFRACAACHSLAPDRNMTGPSLAGVWGRMAGSLESFDRFSPALKASNVVWDETSLDDWLKSPAHFVPENRMTFEGVADSRQRADLIAYLKEASSAPSPAAGSGGMGAAMGGGAQFPDLKLLGPEHQVQAMRYCRDTYHVDTADGKSTDFWEANLRFKTDSSGTGPQSGKPVIMPAGMMGDRASVFFAAPEEIGAFIKHQC